MTHVAGLAAAHTPLADGYAVPADPPKRNFPLFLANGGSYGLATKLASCPTTPP
ncbi:MAG TPA: hypothetical protein VFR40_07600 [Lapillicoccus sp.]|nr:hypothetical protein [Lapillicoccus sp.]